MTDATGTRAATSTACRYCGQVLYPHICFEPEVIPIVKVAFGIRWGLDEPGDDGAPRTPGRPNVEAK